MNEMPAIPKQISKPIAGVSSRWRFQSPSLSRRLAAARPGRIATSKPRAIEVPWPFSLQTYLRRMMN